MNSDTCPYCRAPLLRRHGFENESGVPYAETIWRCGHRITRTPEGGGWQTTCRTAFKPYSEQP